MSGDSWKNLNPYHDAAKGIKKIKPTFNNNVFRSNQFYEKRSEIQKQLLS